MGGCLVVRSAEPPAMQRGTAQLKLRLLLGARQPPKANVMTTYAIRALISHEPDRGSLLTSRSRVPLGVPVQFCQATDITITASLRMAGWCSHLSLTSPYLCVRPCARHQEAALRFGHPRRPPPPAVGVPRWEAYSRQSLFSLIRSICA